MTSANIDERRAYIKRLFDRGSNIDKPTMCNIAVMFGSSVVAVRNDVSLLQTGIAYYKRSRGMGIASVQNNRAQRLGLSGRISRDEWIEVCHKYGNKCAHCKRALPLTMDHIKPLSRGGKHSIDNIQPLCKPCNSSKGNR